MSASKLHKGQPIRCFLAPTSANTASFRQPAQGALDHPAAWRMPFFIRDWLRGWFAATTAMSNMSLIMSLSQLLVNIKRIIRFVQTQVLLAGWTSNDNGDNEVSDRPFIMAVGSAQLHGQRCTSLINQDVNLGSLFAAVGGVAPGCLPAQWSRNSFAVHRLPFPADVPLTSVEAYHLLQQLVPDASALPALEALVQDTAGDTEPVTMDSFPLTACPEDIPDTIDNSAVVRSRPTPSACRGLLGQVLFETPPQRTWDMKEIDILGLCVTLSFGNDAPRWLFVLGKNNFPTGASFFQLISFFG
jgi:hypothetical protein